VGLKRPRRCAGRLGVRGCGYSIGYGIRHVRPCSDKYFANGALAGLYAAFFVAIFWIGDNGENPSITKLEDWYLKSAGN
jgi:hypothetical protein